MGNTMRRLNNMLKTSRYVRHGRKRNRGGGGERRKGLLHSIPSIHHLLTRSFLHARTRSGRHMLWLVGFVVFVFILLWWVVKR